ncbi:hypothetical protein B484DRAFT_402800, partial [Ochromonadaceae sp. CCMP2298]
MSGAKAEKKSTSEYAEAKRTNVLKSTTEPAWAFQNWRDGVETEFKTLGLEKFLQDTTASKFSDPTPKFCWVMDMVNIVAEDPPRPSTAWVDTKFDIDEDDGESLDAEELQMKTPAREGAKDTAKDTSVTEPFAPTPAHSKSSGAKLPETPKGYHREITRYSPETAGFEMADQLMLAPSVEFYYGRLDQHNRQVGERDRKIAVHNEKIDDCMGVVKSALSPAVRVTAEDLLSSRDLYRIWQGLIRLCGPRSSNTGLSALEVKWSTTTIKTAEAMPDFLQRMDKLARSFKAYDSAFIKSEQHCMILVREALKTSKHWEKLEAEIHEAERLELDWEELKIRLVRRASTLDADTTSGKGPKNDSEKALAAQPAVKALMDKAREQGRTQASGKGDGKGDRDTPVSSADNAINITRFRCGQYGHPMVECPQGKKLDAFQKTLPTPTVTKPKAKPAARPAVSMKTAAAAALAALTEDDGDDEGDKDAQEGEVSGAAMCTEPMSMDDWLTTENTCVAYSYTEPANESPAPPPDSESDWEDWLTTDTHDNGSVSDSEPYSSSAADFSTCSPTYGIVTGPHGEQTMLSPPPRYEPQGSGAQVPLSVPGQLAKLGDRGTAGWESEAAGAAYVPSQSSQLVLLGDRGTAGWESEAAGAAH